MALPGDSLPNLAPAQALVSPGDIFRSSRLIDYSRGGVAVQNPSQGINVRNWAITYVGTDVVVYPLDMPANAQILFSEAGVTELSLAFDQNMNPVVAYVGSGTPKLRWFDPNVSATVTTSLASDVRTPYVKIDDPRNFASAGARNDVLLIYLRGNSLYYRQQRERYQTERLLATATEESWVSRAGQNIGSRFQVELGDNAEARTAMSLKFNETPVVDSVSVWKKQALLLGTSVISEAQKKFGLSSLFVENLGLTTENGLSVTQDPDFLFGTEDFTLELWAYRLPTLNNTYLFSWLSPTETSAYVTPSGDLVTTVASSSGTDTDTVSAAIVNDQFSFFVFQRRGNDFEVYLDGLLVSTISVPGGAAGKVNTTSGLFFGRAPTATNNTWNGYIDEIRLTKALARYAGNFQPASKQNCDSVLPVIIPEPENGTAALTGAQIAVTATFNDPSRVSALSGQQLTVSRGSVVVPAYPTFRGSGPGVAIGQFYNSGTAPAVGVWFRPDGNIAFAYERNGVSSPWFVRPASQGWLNFTNSAYTPAQVVDKYRFAYLAPIRGVPSDPRTTLTTTAGTTMADGVIIWYRNGIPNFTNYQVEFFVVIEVAPGHPAFGQPNQIFVTFGQTSIGFVIDNFADPSAPPVEAGFT